MSLQTSISSLPRLFDLGPLYPHIIVARPSKVVRTPYVADMLPSSEKVEQLLSCEKELGLSKMKKAAITHLSASLRAAVNDESELVLGHTPSLDCAGMILPGSTVYCTKSETSKQLKTAFTAQLCEELREHGCIVRVGCHPFLAERATKRMLELELLPEMGKYDLQTVASQQSFGTSRVDYVLTSTCGTSLTLLEVKNCVGADYCEGLVPSGRSDVGVYQIAAVSDEGIAYQRHAIFPHGSKKPGVGVVSDRAIKHVHELTRLHGTKDVKGRTIVSAILFVVNRNDCVAFRPCHEACMLFAQMLHRAYLKGVKLVAKALVWNGGLCSAGPTLPVVFSRCVNSADIDEDHLALVLKFNENGSGRSMRTPSPKKASSPKMGLKEAEEIVGKSLLKNIRKRPTTAEDYHGQDKLATELLLEGGPGNDKSSPKTKVPKKRST